MYQAGDVMLQPDRKSTDRSTKKIACLPHSCEFWVIGGPTEIREMIADLETALKQIGEVA